MCREVRDNFRFPEREIKPMITTISKDITIENPSGEIIDWAEQNLILTNPEYTQLIRMGKEDLIKWKHINKDLYLYYYTGNTLHLPFGCLYAIYDMIKSSQCNLKFNNAGDISFKNDEIQGIDELYDYQEEAVDYMIKAKGGVIYADCSAGKTIMGMELIKRIGKKALWICHTGDLLRQAKQDLLELYPNAKIGLTTEGKLEIGEDVTISTVQTLIKIDPSLYADKFDVVFVDESHHTVSSPTKMKMFGTVLSKIPARYKYGLTATPERADKMTKSMYAYLGCNVQGEFKYTFGIDPERLKKMPAEHQKVEISSGYTEQDLMWTIYDTSGMLDYNALITELCNNNERTEKILDRVVECQKEGRKQVVLSMRVEHCEYMVKRLQERGIKAMLCVGKVSAKKRDEILNQKVEWDVIVATYALLKEGISIKELDTLHLTGPAKETGLIKQCKGRIERFKEGKKQPIIYDYVDMDIPYCVNAFKQRQYAVRKKYK